MISLLPTRLLLDSRGIGVATFGSIILYQILRERSPQPEEAVTADSAVGLDPAHEVQTETTD